MRSSKMVPAVFEWVAGTQNRREIVRHPSFSESSEKLSDWKSTDLGWLSHSNRSFFRIGLFGTRRGKNRIIRM